MIIRMAVGSRVTLPIWPQSKGMSSKPLVLDTSYGTDGFTLVALSPGTSLVTFADLGWLNVIFTVVVEGRLVPGGAAAAKQAGLGI